MWLIRFVSAAVILFLSVSTQAGTQAEDATSFCETEMFCLVDGSNELKLEASYPLWDGVDAESFLTQVTSPLDATYQECKPKCEPALRRCVSSRPESQWQQCADEFDVCVQRCMRR